MKLILYAVPFFFVLIAVELLADRWRGMRTYRLADTVSSLSTCFPSGFFSDHSV